jgi:2'-5' RNA ligase
MPKFTQKYVLVHTIKDLPDGYEYSMADWPLHVTLADVFSIQGDYKDLLRELRECLDGRRPVKAKVIGDEWFGCNKDVHVKLIGKTSDLQKLHETVLGILVGYGAVFNNPEYTKEGFRPHSTVQKTENLEIGDYVVFDSITLIDMYPDGNPYRRRVLGTIH